MFNQDALVFALIIMCVILFITWAVVYSEKDDLEEENKELKVKLEDAIHNNERYLTLSTHQQMQDRSLKIWELEGKIQGRDKHIAELNCKLNVQHRLTSTLMEELANERIKNKQLLNGQDLFGVKFMQEKLNKECALKKEGEIHSKEKTKEPLLKKYQNRRDVIYAIQFSLNNIDRIVEELSNIGVNITICDYTNKTITIHNAYEHILETKTVKEFEYIVKVNKELKVMNAKEFRSLYELEQC